MGLKTLDHKRDAYFEYQSNKEMLRPSIRVVEPVTVEIPFPSSEIPTLTSEDTELPPN